MASNPYVNKVVKDGTTLIDLSGDTVAANRVLAGYTCHTASGEQVTGSVSFATYYVSSSAPSGSQGADGDIWLVTAS